MKKSKELRFFACEEQWTTNPKESSLRALLDFIRQKGTAAGASLAEIEAHFEDYVDGEKERQTAFRQKIADQKEKLVDKLVDRGYVDGPFFVFFLTMANPAFKKQLEEFCFEVAPNVKDATFRVKVSEEHVQKLFQLAAFANAEIK